MSWEDTIREKISELELIASWASIVNLGSVRDHIRHATYELRKELEHRESMEEAMAKSGLFHMPLDKAKAFTEEQARVKQQQLAEYALRKKGDL